VREVETKLQPAAMPANTKLQLPAKPANPPGSTPEKHKNLESLHSIDEVSSCNQCFLWGRNFVLWLQKKLGNFLEKNRQSFETTNLKNTLKKTPFAMDTEAQHEVPSHSNHSSVVRPLPADVQIDRGGVNCVTTLSR
jgi:hypothetical protein